MASRTAVPSTAAVSVLYISISPWCGSPRSIAVLRKTTGAKNPTGFRTLAPPVGRTLVDLRRVAQTSSNWGGAVYCAWVLRDSLLVGDTKRRLRNDADREAS